MFDRANGYDAQGCVEDALRKNPDPTLAVQVKAELELGCRARDAGACSALGVTKELGIGEPKNLRAARNLYDRACQRGNKRGCVNLGTLVLSGAGTDAGAMHNGAFAKSLFTAACDAGEPSGCGALAHMLAKDPSASSEVVENAFGRGCSGGDADSCFELGERSAAQQAAGFYAKACLDGHVRACARLRMPPVHVAGGDAPKHATVAR
ncbi:MAG: sel1 repeat family protein [Polyangiaceae bacterium]|nr:sel1 repeat family protein [Polyangiaceae bacterium]